MLNLKIQVRDPRTQVWHTWPETFSTKGEYMARWIMLARTWGAVRKAP